MPLEGRLICGESWLTLSSSSHTPLKETMGRSKQEGRGSEHLELERIRELRAYTSDTGQAKEHPPPKLLRSSFESSSRMQGFRQPYVSALGLPIGPAPRPTSSSTHTHSLLSDIAPPSSPPLAPPLPPPPSGPPPLGRPRATVCRKTPNKPWRLAARGCWWWAAASRGWALRRGSAATRLLHACGSWRPPPAPGAASARNAASVTAPWLTLDPIRLQMSREAFIASPSKGTHTHVHWACKANGPKFGEYSPGKAT